MIELYLVRHGETEENVAQILQGHLPGYLTALGRQQAIQLAERLNKEHITFDALLCSDLQRTIDTATIIKNHLNQNVTITPCPLLRERDWGRSTGTAISIARSEGIASDAESINDMYRRALQFLSFTKDKYDNKKVLAVGHGLFNRIIQAVLLGCSKKEIPRMQNAEVRHLIVDQLPNTCYCEEESISAN